MKPSIGKKKGFAARGTWHELLGSLLKTRFSLWDILQWLFSRNKVKGTTWPAYLSTTLAPMSFNILTSEELFWEFDLNFSSWNAGILCCLPLSRKLSSQKLPNTEPSSRTATQNNDETPPKPNSLPCSLSLFHPVCSSLAHTSLWTLHLNWKPPLFWALKSRCSLKGPSSSFISWKTSLLLASVVSELPPMVRWYSIR